MTSLLKLSKTNQLTKIFIFYFEFHKSIKWVIETSYLN